MPVPVLLNRGSGTAAATADIAQTVEQALQDAGLEVALSLLDGSAIEAAAKAAVERGDPLLVVGGGDGTISAAAGAVAGTGTALGILPLGTRNHFARDLGLPLELADAARLIASGAPRQVDVAALGERIFVNNSAIGLYPLMVLDRDSQQQRLGRSKWLAMAVASLRTLARFHHQRLTLTVNDERRKIDTPLLFVGNNDYRLELPGAGTRDSLSGGRLCVMVMRKDSRRGFVAAVLRALAGRTRSDDMVKLDDVQRLRVDSRRSRLAVSLDGETCHVAPPFEYRIRPAALRVIVGR